MSILTCTMTDTPAINCNASLHGITNLRNLFRQWIYTIALTSPVSAPSVAKSTPLTSFPMMAHPLNSFLFVSLPAPTTSSAPTRAPYNQTIFTAPCSPRVVLTPAPIVQTIACSIIVYPTSQASTMAPTAQPIARFPSFFMAPLRSTNPISHRTRYCAYIPPPYNEPISC